MILSSARTVPALISEMASLGSHPAVVDGDTTLSYSELQVKVREVARAYFANGVRHGDQISVWAPNRVEFILAMLGAQLIGAAVVPLNTRYTGYEAAEILTRSRTSVLVVADGFLGRNFSTELREAASTLRAGGATVPGLPHLNLVVTLQSEARYPSATTWERFLASGADITVDQLEAATNAVAPDTVMDILFTSGTTGAPKGVLSAHQQTLSVARAWSHGAELNSSDRYAIVNPFFHGFGYKAGIISALLAGATIYPVAIFDPTRVLELIQSEQITVLPGVPTIFTSLLDHPRLNEFNTSSLRFAIAGATAAPATLFHDMVNVLGFQRVAQAYGLTECVVATLSRPGEELEHASQTTGPAVMGTEILVVDAEGDEVPTGQDGEILLRGSNVMLGYFDDDESTRAAFDDNGWFRTGDIGQLDEHGCLKITDRLKDMFIVGGFNVYPAEVESVLRQHPAVNESAVIGIDDKRLGAVGQAHVLLLQNAEMLPSAEDLEAFCRSRLANFKVPREFRIVTEFPRTGTGKILKSALRDAN